MGRNSSRQKPGNRDNRDQVDCVRALVSFNCEDYVEFERIAGENKVSVAWLVRESVSRSGGNGFGGLGGAGNSETRAWVPAAGAPDDRRWTALRSAACARAQCLRESRSVIECGVESEVRSDVNVKTPSDGSLPCSENGLGSLSAAALFPAQHTR
jgi:hypothetical protein